MPPDQPPGHEVPASGDPVHVWAYWEDRPGRRRAAYLDLCLETIERQLDDRMKLHLLDEKSVFEWLPDLSATLWTKLETPISRSDYARVRLVERYGGLWLDVDCIAVSSLRALVEPLSRHSVVGWGADLGGRFYNGLFAGRAGSPMLRHWIALQDELLGSRGDWSALPWAALGQDLMPTLTATHSYHNLESSKVAPVKWYEWRRFLSPYQSATKVLSSSPVTVMLWNSAMEPELCRLEARDLLTSRMLIGRLLRIAVGISAPDDETEAIRAMSWASDVRFSRPGRALEHRLRTLLKA